MRGTFRYAQINLLVIASALPFEPPDVKKVAPETAEQSQRIPYPLSFRVPKKPMPIPVLCTKVLLMWKMGSIYFQALARVMRSRYTTAK